MNPLWMNEILQNIFQRLDFRSLAVARSVCLQWEYIATPIFLRRARILFNGSNETIQDLINYINIVEKSPNRICPHLKLEFIQWKNPWLHCLLKKTGHAVSSLDLKLFSYFPIRNVSIPSSCTGLPIKCKEFREILCNVPHLEELIISGIPPDFWGETIFLTPDQKNPIFNLKRIFINLPDNIPTVDTHFWNYLFIATHKLEEVFVLPESVIGLEHEVINGLIQTGRMSQLKSLQLNEYQNFRMIVRSTKVDQFKKIIVDKLNWAVQTIYFHRFLHMQCESLEYLQFQLDSGDMDLMPKFPIMKKLKELHINAGGRNRGDYDDSLFVNYPSNLTTRIYLGIWDFNLQFPVLSILSMRGNALEYSCREIFPPEVDNKLYICYSVKELEVPNWLHPDVCPRIGKIFVNITRLNIPVQTQQALRLLLEFCPLLQDLQISLRGDKCQCRTCGFSPLGEEDHCIDSVLTGVPNEQFDELKLAKNTKMLKSTNFEHLILTSPIYNLKSLKRLILREPFNHKMALHRSDKITDISGYLAFTKLTELIYFSMTNDLNAMTKECIADLCNQLDLSNESHNCKSIRGSGIRLVKRGYGYEGLEEDPIFFKP